MAKKTISKSGKVKPSTPAAKTAGKSKPHADAVPAPKKVSTSITTKNSREKVPGKPVAPTRPTPAPAKPLVPPVEEDAQSNGLLTEDELKKFKSGLNKRDLERYRQLLRGKRAQILGDVDSIQTDARNKNSGGNLSNMPLHMADVGTDNYDQEFNLGLVESERKFIREIDAALLRIDKGVYGLCLQSGKPIGKPRLDVKPWARFCIEVTREKERRGQEG